VAGEGVVPGGEVFFVTSFVVAGECEVTQATDALWYKAVDAIACNDVTGDVGETT